MSRDLTISDDLYARLENEARARNFDSVEQLLENKLPESMLSHYLEVWKKTVDVQQHFNDLELRIRNLAITVLGALLSGAALSLKETINVTLFDVVIPLAIVLMGIALIVWAAFYFMDRFWYHPLLIGSVLHGIAIETRFERQFPGIALTKAIGEASPLNPPIISRFGMQLRTSGKMDLFYGLVSVSIVALIILLWIGKGLYLPLWLIILIILVIVGLAAYRFVYAYRKARLEKEKSQNKPEPRHIASVITKELDAGKTVKQILEAHIDWKRDDMLAALAIVVEAVRKLPPPNAT